jgi:glycosyltransferase involved in cell wall biosynthesis
MRSPRVSIVIPTYRHAAFILDTLQSALAQRASDVQIIVVNDGSPDETKSLLEPLAQSGRIEYVEQPNQGVARARNNGIARARGEYIALLDDDDLWPPDKLQWQIDFLDANPDVGVVGGTLQIIDDRSVLGPPARFHPEITFDSLFLGNPFDSPGQTLIRADVLRAVGGLSSSIWGADDWDLWFRIAKRSRIAMVDRLALYYRHHAQNASKQTGRMIAACCDTIDRHLPDAPARTRAIIRYEAHSIVYSTYGTLLTRDARARVRNHDFIGAARSLWGLRPLAYSLLRESSLRHSFLADVRAPLGETAVNTSS